MKARARNNSKILGVWAFEHGVGCVLWPNGGPQGVEYFALSTFGATILLQGPAALSF